MLSNFPAFVAKSTLSALVALVALVAFVALVALTALVALSTVLGSKCNSSRGVGEGVSSVVSQRFKTQETFNDSLSRPGETITVGSTITTESDLITT